ncbi:MAG: NCS2 family permease [bacterium]|nr:NCS2 family permease [bacterium]
MLERVFRLTDNGSSPRVEILAGLATFWSMAYIIFANPLILAAAGVPFTGAVVATCLASALATAAMGLATNRPLALAPAMGINAFLAFGVILALALPWQAGMGLVLIHGLLLALLARTGHARTIAGAVPVHLRRGVAAGIGLLIVLVGLQQAGLVIPDPTTLVTFGTLRDPRVFVATAGILFTAVLLARRVRGAILAGVLATAVLSVLVGVQDLPRPVARFPGPETVATFGGVSLGGLLGLGAGVVIATLVLADLFDTVGTVEALESQGAFRGSPPWERILMIDGLASALGGLLGVSALTTYAESQAGVAAGGRTGLTAVVVASLFLLAVFFTPFVGLIPGAAVAPALVVVGYLMAGGLREIPFGSSDEAFPAFLTAVAIPLTFSVARGLGYGFLAHAVMKLSGGKRGEVHPLVYGLAALFLLSFLIG